MSKTYSEFIKDLKSWRISYSDIKINYQTNKAVLIQREHLFLIDSNMYFNTISEFKTHYNDFKNVNELLVFIGNNTSNQIEEIFKNYEH